MIPIEAACGIVKPNTQSANNNAPKIPNCAAPPNNAVFGLASNGPKSVIAPTPIKIINGKIP